MIQKYDVEQGSEEWHGLRRGKITGTSAVKLLKYRSRKHVSSNDESSFKGNFATKRGQLLEKQAIEIYEKIKRNAVDHCGLVTNSLYPNCSYSPDGYIPDVRLIEVKCFFEDNHSKLLEEDISMAIMAQIQFGMMIMELPVTDLIAYNPRMSDVRDRFKIITVDRDENIISNFENLLGGV